MFVLRIYCMFLYINIRFRHQRSQISADTLRDAGPGALPAERHTSLNCIELGVIGFGIRQKSLIVRRSTEKHVVEMPI